jgi:hypothetical protein
MANKFTLKNKYGFMDDEIRVYQDLNNGALTGIEKKFISQAKYQHFRQYLDVGGWRPIIHNKWFSANFFSSENIRQPKSFGILHPTSGWAFDDKPLKCAMDLYDLVQRKHITEFVMKHIAGGLGDSVYIVEEIENREEEAIFITVDGTRLQLKDIDKLLKKVSGKFKGYIIEERLKNHTMMNKLSNGNLSSIRFYTLRLKNGECVPYLAYIRLGAEGKATDHASKGAILAPVDIDSGIVKKGICKTEGNEWLSTHPKTNYKFEGVTIPGWESVISLVVAAARKCPGLHWVGWDVVLSPEGPYLLEGNVGNTMMNLQLLYGGFLVNGIFNDWVIHLVPESEKSEISNELTHWRSRFVKKKMRSVLRL